MQLVRQAATPIQPHGHQCNPAGKLQVPPILMPHPTANAKYWKGRAATCVPHVRIPSLWTKRAALCNTISCKIPCSSPAMSNKPRRQDDASLQAWVSEPLQKTAPQFSWLVAWPIREAALAPVMTWLLNLTLLWEAASAGHLRLISAVTGLGRL